jgi:long-chain acyl-CoA synthetase
MRISFIMAIVRSTLASYLDDFLLRGDDTAFVHKRALRTARWSYGLVTRTAYQFSRELEARSIGKGDRVLIWAESSPEWVAVFFGCLVRGAIAVPLDVQSESDFVDRVARQVEAKLAVIDQAALGKAPPEIPAIEMEKLGSILSCHAVEPPSSVEASPDDTAEIVFTSGTTAEPKGVCITHRNLLANLDPLEREIAHYRKYERFVHPLRFLNLLPLSHVFGQLMGVFVPQLLGGEVFFQASLNPSHIIETVKRGRISVIVAVPRVLDTLRVKIERDYEVRGELERFHRTFAAARGRYPLSRWWKFRRVHSTFGWKFWAFISGGAALDQDTEEFWDRLGFAVIQGYGMTETASLVSVNHPFKLVRGSIGAVMPGQEVRLADDGEILVRGENVTAGYGWFRTGDVGELDAKGNLRFKGRKKDVIVTSAGMKIHPEDVERALDREPEVKASAVVTAVGPDGPEPLAVLVMRDPQADAKAVIERANVSLARHQRVRRWFVWPGEDFPRTPTQKVRRQLVAELVVAAVGDESRSGVHSPVASGRGGTIDEIVAGLRNGAPGRIDPSATLGTDLKLDSLGRIELLSEIEERYQVDLDEAAFTETTTLGDVDRIIREGTHGETVPYPYPRWQQRPPLGWLRILFLHLLVLPAVRILGRPAADGAEHLRGIREPLVFVCNHVTEVDHALVIGALPARFRNRLAIAMDGEILRERRYPSPATGLGRRILYRIEYLCLVFFFNVFSMPRKSGFRRSFAFAGEMMDRGCSILVFPEGRHTQDGAMNPFMPGAGMLAAELGAPVIPIRIDGLWQLKQAGRRRARSGEISIRIGAPVRYSIDDPPARIARDLEERVRGDIRP